MGNADDALIRLLSNGQAVADTYERCKRSDGALDWEQFTAAARDGELVERILGVGTPEIDAALERLRAERRQLRRQWKGKEMPDEVIERLSHLSDLGAELAEAKLDVGLTPGYVTWMMERAKPALERAAHTLFQVD